MTEAALISAGVELEIQLIPAEATAIRDALAYASSVFQSATKRMQTGSVDPSLAAAQAAALIAQQASAAALAQAHADIKPLG